MNKFTQRSLKTCVAFCFTARLAGCTAEISGTSASAAGGTSSTAGVANATPDAASAAAGTAAGGGTTTATTSACQSDPALRLPPLFRALNGRQYANVLRTALPAARDAIDAMPNPWQISEVSTRYTTDGTSLKMNQAAVSNLLDGTRAIAASARASIKTEHPCLAQLGTGAARSACLGEVTDALLGRLFNGPIVESERAAKVDYLSQLLSDFGLDLALETFTATVMMSPRTLFRSELGASAAAAGPVALTARELAEALSFAVAETRPDTALLAAVEDGTLSPEELRTHARRLASAAARSGAEGFVAETLTLPQLSDTTRTENGKDAFPESLRAALQLEAQETIKRLVRAGGSLVNGLFTTDIALARRETLSLHGVDPTSVTPDANGFYSLTSPSRPGLILQPSMMALLAAENHSDAVKRGHFMMSQFMCVPIPPPPPDVPPLPAVDAAKPLTVRQRLETVHKLPACQGCHKLMDGIGLSFEAFDHLGRERTMELGQPVDTSGEVGVGIASLDGKLNNAQELMARMAKAPEVETCVATQAFTYLSGVYAETNHDGCLWQAAKATVQGTEGDLVDSFAALLGSDLYRLRYAD